MSNLPTSFCIDIVAEKEHKRLHEFKDWMNSKTYRPIPYEFSERYYGSSANQTALYDKPFGELLTLDRFFELLEPKIYTISDLANGVCAVENDGTVEDLQKVLKAAFPYSPFNATGNFTLYYRSTKDDGTWGTSDHLDMPTQSVKLFLQQLEKPLPITSINVGDEVEQFDNINKPKHYTSGKVECIDAIESAISELKGMDAFCTGNAIKYSWRWKQKNGIEDLEKAVWYINKLIELNTK